MNISKMSGSNGNDTSVSASMYLSFDSTLSSVSAYKTLETSDLEEAEKENLLDSSVVSDHMNSTLEAGKFDKTSPTQTVKKLSQNTAIASPLKAFPKNIMKEYKAMCSTPSKEQIMRSVDVQRGSDADRCMDLGLAFKGVDEDKISPLAEIDINLSNVANESTCKETQDTNNKIIKSKDKGQEVTKDEGNVNVNLVQIESNDEKVLGGNTQVELENDDVHHISNVEEGSQISTSVSIDTLSVALEQKLAMMSTTDEESVIEGKQVTLNLETQQLVPGSVPSFKPLGESNDLAPKPIAEKKDVQETKPTMVKKARKSVIPKMRQSLVPSSSTRRSIMEPNLQTNRPSRISILGKKTLPFLKVKPMKDSAQEIPNLISKMINLEKQSEKPNKVEQQTNIPTIKEPARKRTSLQASCLEDKKKPYGFTQRMSIVVKTTLNSPARKIPRTSIPGNASARKSSRPSLLPRKSMAAPQVKKLQPCLEENSNLEEKNLKSKPEIPVRKLTARKSMFPMSSSSALGKSSEGLDKVPLSAMKKQTSFVCNVCKCEFRIKSLLDAHKRSHEDFVPTPGALKKTSSNISNVSSASSSTSSGTNKCKYCDKKFALLRALHIHLLQNCTKIPAKDKRKLQYTEMNHVTKAQIPHFDFNQESTDLKKSNQDVKSSVESLADKKGNNVAIKKQPEASGIKTPNNVNKLGGIPSSNKMYRKSTAHSGIYRTPSKKLLCHSCKLSFKSILEYTQHSMTHNNSNEEIPLE